MFKNLTIAAFLGFFAILLGAFGAHALKEQLTVGALSNFNTGVRYQMYHVVVVFFVNGVSLLSEKQKNTISYLFFTGIVLFSGSIYLIYLAPISATSIWFITPLGGLFLLSGWLYMMLIFMHKIKPKK